MGHLVTIRGANGSEVAQREMPQRFAADAARSLATEYGYFVTGCRRAEDGQWRFSLLSADQRLGAVAWVSR